MSLLYTNSYQFVAKDKGKTREWWKVVAKEKVKRIPRNLKVWME